MPQSSVSCCRRWKSTERIRISCAPASENGLGPNFRERILDPTPYFAKFGEASDWVKPRRIYLGTRFSF